LITEVGNTLCPETGFLEFNGLLGTNLFVTPKEDWTSSYEIYYEKYSSAYIQYYQASEIFSIKKYL
jgi:hypothetical protein